MKTKKGRRKTAPASQPAVRTFPLYCTEEELSVVAMLAYEEFNKLARYRNAAVKRLSKQAFKILGEINETSL